MLSLTRIFLHNWHRFTSVVLDVQDSLYLTGHNGSGKSTILDAMQVVLLADLNLIKFNSSAQERSERTLNGFVRGKIAETRWLRPGNCVSYIALEFTDTESGKNTVLGCCIEAGETLGPNGERTYFILHERLDITFFLSEGQPLTRSQLKKALQKNHNGKSYDVINEYQDDLLVALGNLHRRFFDRFRHAFSFSPITNVNRFVEEWLLNEYPLQLQDLLVVVSRLQDLEKTAKGVEEKIEELTVIRDKRGAYQRLKFLQNQFELLHALLQKEDACREVHDAELEIQLIQEESKNAERKQSNILAVLEAAQRAKEETAKQLYGLDVVKQQKNLKEKIQEKTSLAEEFLEKKKQLLQDLRNISVLLHVLRGASLLEAEELPSVSSLHEMLIHLTEEAPLSIELPGLVDAAMASLRSVLARVQARKIVLEERIRQSGEKSRALENEIRLLTQGASISYPPQVRTLRERLETVIGEHPMLLCEQVEIPDERWQTAVEALLGERRFLILAPVGTYERVLHYIETIKKDTRLHDASVLDLEKAYAERREALVGSLAQEITTNNPYLRAYIDSILGNVMTCESSQDVRKYRRAITADLIYYNEWAVRVLPVERFRVWFVGQRARASQIEARKQELTVIRQELSQLTPLHTQAINEEKQLDEKLIRPLLLLRKSLDAPPDDIPLRIEIDLLTAQHDALDMSSAIPLTAELQRLDGVIKKEAQALSTISTRLGELSSNKEAATGRKLAADQKQAERHLNVVEMQKIYPEVIDKTKQLFREQKEEKDLKQVIFNAERAVKSYVTQSERTMRELRDLGLSYNINHHFAGIPESLDNDRYQQELERLEATELPLYRERITQAKQETDQELREHVLHILRERIENAKDELQRMNEALKPLTFHGDHYQFRWYPADAMREYHDLIVNSQLLGAGSLFESEFYQNNQEAFDKFYNDLTRPTKNEAEERAKKRLTDYRTYLEYDIEIKHHDLTTSRLSRIAGETSGGETQTPFYVAVAASFVQLYHIMDEGKRRRGRPTIRLAVFDEAFNRMDQDRIGVTLDMLQRFGLQIVTATPLERCEYLVPKICTNLVLTRVGEKVLIDEYSNYAAKLEERYAEATPDVATRSENHLGDIARSGGTA